VFSIVIGGVEYLHSKGIVHRDIKSENVVIDSDRRARICDFGMAQKHGES
jgi:serine/threonine protein kinase